MFFLLTLVFLSLLFPSASENILILAGWFPVTDDRLDLGWSWLLLLQSSVNQGTGDGAQWRQCVVNSSTTAVHVIIKAPHSV